MDKTFEEYLKELEQLKADSILDADEPHAKADEILCEIALNTTFSAEQRKVLVEAYNQIEKWYS